MNEAGTCHLCIRVDYSHSYCIRINRVLQERGELSKMSPDQEHNKEIYRGDDSKQIANPEKI
jgi:hypothetical protein